MTRTGTRVKRPFLRALPLFCLAILALNAQGQFTTTIGQDTRTPKYVPGMSSYDTAPGTGVLVFHIFAEKTGTRLDSPARLDLTNLANRIGVFQIIEGDTEAVFINLDFGNYEIEVSALGYLSARQRMQVVSTIHPEPIDIVLSRDPAAIRLDVAPGDMPANVRKEAKSGLSLLKAGYLPDAQKKLEKAYKLAPTNSDLNFLLGYLYFQEHNYQQATKYLGTAVNLSPHNAQASTLLGRAHLAQGNYPAAKSALEQAVLADDDNWLPHDLLGDVYLHQKDYSKARDEAQIAIAKGQRIGRVAAGAAEVVLGQAFLGLGQKQDAIQAFHLFLNDVPQNPLVYQVHALVAELERHNPSSAPGVNSDLANTIAGRADPVAAVPDPNPSTQTWRPFDIDDLKPTLAPGIACPASRVMEQAGEKVKAFVQDLARFAADENLLHQSIDAFGVATRTETRKYDYVAVVSESNPAAVSIDEYRSDKLGQEGSPDGIRSTGFMTLALVFHPDMQKDFEFDCEGQGEWRGQTSWIVHFRQRQDRPNRMHGYRIAGQSFPVALKGRGWISGDQFQILRMEADMVSPVREIQLLSEHQVVEYGPVPFLKKNTTLWLPKSAEIYLDFRKHHYYRRHSLDHYMLFAVDTEEKRKEPVAKPAVGTDPG